MKLILKAEERPQMSEGPDAPFHKVSTSRFQVGVGEY